jgi:hypothetical protein
MMSLRVIEHDVDAISPLETLLWREDLTRVRAAIQPFRRVVARCSCSAVSKA